MEKNALLERISVHPEICFGKPCIRGTRIWVSLVLDLLSQGSTIVDIIKHYPNIKNDDILACIAYGSVMSHEHYVDIKFHAA